MTVRASNDNGTGEPTLAPERSSLPEGNRSGPPAVWMDHSIQILKITGIGPTGSGGPIPSINSVTSAARRIASIILQGNRRARCGASRYKGWLRRKPQTGWFQSRHFYECILERSGKGTTPSAPAEVASRNSLWVAATPPDLGRDTLVLRHLQTLTRAKTQNLCFVSVSTSLQTRKPTSIGQIRTD